MKWNISKQILMIINIGSMFHQQFGSFIFAVLCCKYILYLIQRILSEKLGQVKLSTSMVSRWSLDPPWPQTDPLTTTKHCHTLHQTLATSCTKPCNTLYQTFWHLVPNPVTPCIRLFHIWYQTLSLLVPSFVTPYTRPFHTLYQRLVTPCTGTSLARFARPPASGVPVQGVGRVWYKVWPVSGIRSDKVWYKVWQSLVKDVTGFGTRCQKVWYKV